MRVQYDIRFPGQQHRKDGCIRFYPVFRHNPDNLFLPPVQKSVNTVDTSEQFLVRIRYAVNHKSRFTGIHSGTPDYIL